MSIKSDLKQSYLYKFIAYRIKRRTVLKNPYAEIERCYTKIYPNKRINLENPVNLIEKIYWMEWNSDTTLWTKCADKYGVREYLNSCGLGYTAPKLLAKWDDPKDIDFTGLPNEFIIKTNDGCATNYIVKDKSKENVQEIISRFKAYMKFRQGYSNAQYHYLEIKPCIIVEELLHQSEDLNKYSPNSLIDYKVWCFNGKPECILVVYDRDKKSYNLDLYDLNWNRLSDKLLQNGHFRFSDKELPRPNCLDKMISLAAQLSKPFQEVRVDFYIINNEPVFGELTFSSGYGYFTDEYYNYLGSKIDLSKVERVGKDDKIRNLKKNNL